MTSWFTQLKPDPRARFRLFCFPHAGGASTSFHRWPQHISSGVEICAAQLPGRGRRIKEPPETNLLILVEKLAHAIRPYLDRPFVFFGHSMGALISFELARRLRREKGGEPAHLFVSGRRAPQIAGGDDVTYNLPTAEFINELRRLNGTPAEVLEHPELMELMLPLLRADFEMVETYAYSAETPLACPISAYGGAQDSEVKLEHLRAWRDQTTADFTSRMFAGDHFFIYQDEALPQAIDRELRARYDLNERHPPAV